MIPDSAFGRIITRDLCKPCNDRFGQICDHALINDQRIINAAGKAGHKFTDLHGTFVGKQKTSSGGEIRMLYRNGNFCPLPQLSPKQNLIIPANQWKATRQQIEGALIAKVARRNLPLTNEQIRIEVRRLLAAVDADPSKTHFNETIGEGFQPTKSSGLLAVIHETYPWETEWCLAKIVFELSVLVWPDAYQFYCKPVIALFRDFLEKQEHDKVSKTGQGIFTFTQEDTPPQSKHEIINLLSPRRIEWELRFFGTACWKWSSSLTPVNGHPDQEYRIVVANLFGPENLQDASVVCTRVVPME